ncbi:MAG TPA: hypothetical protein VGM51_16840 [Armatimonadota bacterium]
MLLCALFAGLSFPARCTPKVILFLSSAPTVRDVFEADAPALQSLITHGGVAFMTTGPPDVLAVETCGANGYVTYRQRYDRDTGVVTDEARVNGALLLNSEPVRLGYLAAEVAPFGKIVPVGGPGAIAFVSTASLFMPGGPTDTGLWQGNLSAAVPSRFARCVHAAAQHASVVVVDPIDPFNPSVLSPTEMLKRLSEEDSVLATLRKESPGASIVAIGVGEWMWIAVSNLHGRLTSDTTRTPGVVSNLDVAPTLIAMVTGKAPADAVGRVIRSGAPEGLRHGMPKPVEETIRLQDALGVIENATDTVNYAIAFGAIALILAGSLLSGAKGLPTLKRWLQYAMLLAVAAPLGVAVSAWRQPEAVRVFYALAVAATVALLAAFILLGRALAASREDRILATIQVAAGAFCAFVIADVARHGMPLRLSPLSNFYQTGIRFYGLGNEYGALFIAAFTFLGLVTLQRSALEKASTAAIAVLGAWYAGCALFIGWPTFGANMGGLIVALVTGGVTWYFVARRSGVRHPWLWPLLIGGFCFAAIVISDAHAVHATHIGRFFSSSDDHHRAAIVLNKVEMNARLFVTPVAWALYTLGAGFAWYWWRRLGVLRRRATQAYPWMALGVRSVLYGGVLALFSKDTGVVMLGLMAAVAIGIGVMLALEPPALKIIQDGSRNG